MKFVRFIPNSGQGSDIKWGILKNDEVEIIDGTPFEDWKKTSDTIKDYEARFLSPCVPSKIVCIGLNYKEHADELKMEIPEEPVLFIKPSSSLLNPEGYIVKPSICKRLDYEAELAAVIKKRARNVLIDEVRNYILGYTCFNDVTARDIQKRDGQWTRAKSFDTFAPIGPVLRTDIDPGKLKIELVLNGNVMQSSNTSNMVFSIERLVSYVSEVMTLYPGDVIATGTPPRVGGMGAGDIVEVVIEEIGALRNYVTDEGQ
ncbi:MAG: fumarylacetoacetate hydrolase family protein [Elusimicrobiota bacterium]